VPTGTRARAAAGLRIWARDTPSPQVRNRPSGMISRTRHDARRAAGSRDASLSGASEAPTGPAGWTIAVPWKLTVAGGMGKSSDSRPPRRTGTVTDTRPPSAMCRAFQLSGATAAYSRRPAAAYTTPLDRGSPAGVT
jgi:hypothetical protein